MRGQAFEEAYPYAARNALRPLAEGGGEVRWQLLSTNLPKQRKPAIEHRGGQLVLARAGIEAIHQSANLFIGGPLNATVVRDYSRHVASTPSELWIIVRSFRYGAP